MNGMPFGYWRTRNWRRLIYSIPALLSFIATCSLSVAMAFLDSAQLARSNLQQAQYLTNTNPKLALIHAETACALNPKPESLMMLAQLCNQLGDIARQKEILMSLAPSNRLGHPPAHVALARLLLSEPTTIPQQSLAHAARHLQRIADLHDDAAIEANSLLGELYWKSGLFAKAIPHLRRTPVKSEFRVLLADAANRCGDRETAEAEAKICRDEFSARSMRDPADIKARLCFAACLRILNEYRDAILICERGMALAPPTEAADDLRKLRDTTYVDWLAALEHDPKANQAKRFEVLETALAAAPADWRFLNGLLLYSAPDTDEGKKARAYLEKELRDGRNVGLAHYVLGQYASSEGDRAKNDADKEAHRKAAKIHYEIAHQEMPLNAAVSNNLAWFLATTSPPELERAHTMIDDAIACLPNNPALRHTRARIFMKMERWREAIVDLELALAGDTHPDRANLHEALAKAYEMLGDERTAARHRNAVATNHREK